MTKLFMERSSQERCAMKGCHDEIYDEGPFCENCFGDIYIGQQLRGDFGERERKEAIRAVAQPWSVKGHNRRRIRHLIGLANWYLS